MLPIIDFFLMYVIGNWYGSLKKIHSPGNFLLTVPIKIIFENNIKLANVSNVSNVSNVGGMFLLRKAYRCHSKIRLSHARNGKKGKQVYSCHI